MKSRSSQCDVFKGEKRKRKLRYTKRCDCKAERQTRRGGFSRKQLNRSKVIRRERRNLSQYDRGGVRLARVYRSRLGSRSRALLVQRLKDLGDLQLRVALLQPTGEGQALGLEEIHVEDLALVPGAQVTEDGHYGVAWTQLLG